MIRLHLPAHFHARLKSSAALAQMTFHDFSLATLIRGLEHKNAE
jgi:hypothetical protein